MVPGVGAGDVVAVGVREMVRVAVGGAEHALDCRAGTDGDAVECDRLLDVAGAGLHRWLPAHRFLDPCRQQRPIGPDRGESGRV